MAVIGQTSHALFFNGVSDSVVCPQGDFTQTGHKRVLGGNEARSSAPVLQDGDSHRFAQGKNQSLTRFTIEAWVSPDCGGVIASKDGLFELRMGSVDAPAPASFSVTFSNGVSSIARSANNYPTPADSFISNDVGYNTGQRELYHIAGEFDGSAIRLLVNGELMAAQVMRGSYTCNINDQDLFIGGKGGEYRGYIESVHWKKDVSTSTLKAQPCIRSVSTIGLWRFEEPVEVDDTVFNITSAVSAGDTTITIGTTQCQTMYELVSGKSDTLSSNYTLESLGNYRVANAAHSGGAQVISVAHTPFNLLINPTGTDILTGIPNGTAPERVRLKAINTDGTITVDSIHLDFGVSSDTGSRGVLHARTAFHTSNNIASDSTMVLIRSDLLIDGVSGKPYQTIGTGSQAIDRTGAMVIDESGNDFHGFMFSRNIATGNNFSPSSWTLADRFKIGHTGRHKYTQRKGHPYLRFLPPVHEQEVTRTIDGISDEVLVTFSGNAIGLKEQLPINSKVSVTHTATNSRFSNIITRTISKGIVRNGLASIDANRDGVIAISVEDIRPFLLKGGGIDVSSVNDSQYKKHLAPETESRIAILEVTGLDAGYVEIHYNAIDLTGGKMGLSDPALLITKTVPDGGCLLNGKRVAAHIADAITANANIHSAGGVIEVPSQYIGDNNLILQPHYLVGDNTGGIEYADDLDESLIPSNYSPRSTGDEPSKPPQGVGTSKHPSAYHLLHLQPRRRNASNPPSNTLTGTYQESQQFASQKGGAFELFDIIDNDVDGDDYIFIVQPSKRERTMQLSRATSTSLDSKDPTTFTVEFVQSVCRIKSMQIGDSSAGRTLYMEGVGLMDDLSDQSVAYNGDGSSDSHIVKEIQPGAPVVSVTLGGAGQGAVNTKPSWDPATLARIGWNTRHDMSTEANGIDTTNYRVNTLPLNNLSPSLTSWGTYGFPATGRIYLTNGANAEYSSRTGLYFQFAGTSSAGSGVFKLGNGREVNSFSNWVTQSKLQFGDTILLDPLFNSASICADGTTINDRLFQSIGSVQHDYQLGTQYASTRALVEIPLFPQQFFEDRSAGILPGPDNSMKLHLDATMTAHTYNPSPVGRRAPSYPANDYEAYGQFQYRLVNNLPIKATVQRYDRRGSNTDLYIQEGRSRIPYSKFDSAGTVRGVSIGRARRIILGNGEWAYYEYNGGSTVTLSNADGFSSKDFFSSLSVGSQITIGEVPNGVNFPMTGDTDYASSGQEYRRPFYYDRGSVMTQGGNLDYGLRQYVSAVEFKAGPLANPHLPRIESGGAKLKLIAIKTGQTFYFEGNLPKGHLPTNYAFAAVNESTGRKYQITYNSSTADNELTTAAHTVLDNGAPNLSAGDTLTVIGIYATSLTQFPIKQPDSIANSTWNNPYCGGGLRYGDTVWMNMHYTNPHAIEGMFCKSRGVFNEYEVWSGFNGGKGALGDEARDTLPIENFLIGNTCIETARNFVQHVNKTIELNWADLGHTTNAPVVAYLDPYLTTETHARVLLYDVAHDREFIAFHDLHMQVQTSATTPTIEGLDVAAGFRTQRKDRSVRKSTSSQTIDSVSYDLLDSVGKSQFVESAYAHRMWWLMDEDYLSVSGVASTASQYVRKGRANEHYIKFGEETEEFGQGRVSQSTISISNAQTRHAETADHDISQAIVDNTSGHYEFSSTFFDTPDGTRVISAFLCLKGKRATNNALGDHYESRLQHLPHWEEMEFIRRLTIDMGEVGLRIGNTNIEVAAREVVRLINQGGALNGRSSQRRPSDQYAGEGERFDINRRSNSVVGSDTQEPTDATAVHHHADFAVTGSTHDPAPFWMNSAFTSFDRGSHMGYLRAHIGRVVEDANGNEGYSIVIHSTVPGATGRNFCAWLDNSKGQSEYKPQFLVGHGGRFRNFFCSPPEITGENMHPAPMPIDKNGKPFAPITTLREYVALDEVADEFITNLHLGYASNYNTNEVSGEETPNTGATLGRSSNSGAMESFENAGQKFTIREGLQMGTRAKARVNFGGIVAAGIPGFAPDAGIWGFGEDGKSGRFTKVYGQYLSTGNDNYSSYSSYAPSDETKDSAVGTSNLYGMKMVDHRGKSHILRYIYRTAGSSFSHRNSVMPKTIDEETLIYFDDRDVAQGGFTIGAHMWGEGGQGTPFFYTGTTDKSWRGNKWRGVYTPNAGYAVTVDTSTANNTLTLNDASGYGYHDGGIWHHLPNVDDVLGWMGFPDSGLVWLAIPSSTSQYSQVGVVFSYTSRTHNGRGGEHSFFGVEGENADTMAATYFSTQAKAGPTSVSNNNTPVIISPHLNQTTIVTDELIAAATAYAFTVDPNEEDQYFDCSHLRAPDGKTYAEWMGDRAKTAIKITTFNDKKEVTPLSDMFSISLSKDWGISASTKEHSTISASHNTGGQFGGSLSAQEINGLLLDSGYLPSTLLTITTRYRGHNANTATPILIDQNNNSVSTDDWQKHLRGDKFTRFEGDHITPALEAHTFEVDSQGSLSSLPPNSKDTYQIRLRDPHNFAVLGRQYAWQLQHVDSSGQNFNYDNSTEFGGAIDGSWSPFKRMDIDEDTYLYCAAFSSIDNPTDVDKHLIGWHHEEAKGDFNTKLVLNLIMQRFKFVNDIQGMRLRANRRGNPLLYFRGAQDSTDHNVPLYFGGGFSGVVMDINDGSRVDYSTHNKHPYAKGPTGSAGLQDIGEKMGSFALLDTTALLAMFPATALLNQHRGEATPPFANVDAVMTPDLDGNTDTHTIPNTTYTNVNIAQPIPVVLRFAHPYARYDDTENSVAYMIFGPGQAVPKHWRGESQTMTTSVEPSAKWTAAWKKYCALDGTIATTFNQGVESGYYLPNELSNTEMDSGNEAFLPNTDAYGANNVFPYIAFRHWEPAYGSPNSNFNQTKSTTARNVSSHFFTSTQTIVQSASVKYAHPFSHYNASERFSGAITDFSISKLIFHLDGGYTAGGSWFDNSVRKNAPHPVTTNLVNSANSAVQYIDRIGLNATMFRVGSQVLTDYDHDLDADVPDDVFLIDATRCQNSEELGAVIAAAINTFPGRANLKALGGSFLPSFQDAQRQDRYGWIDVGTLESYDGTNGVVKRSSALPLTLPENGWIRVSDGTNSYYGHYSNYDYSKGDFILGGNFRSNSNRLEQPDGTGNGSVTSVTGDDSNYKIFVWSKAGNLRWDNGFQNATDGTRTTTAALSNDMSSSPFDHYATTQVHFSGVVDAIDRTRAIGAVGWHGERYSYFNSLTIDSDKVAAGLGAWLPNLGFNPYGSAMGCHQPKSIEWTLTNDAVQDTSEVAWTPTTAGNGGKTITGLHQRHFIVISYEGDLPIIAKASRNGQQTCGDMLQLKWSSSTQGGTVVSYHNDRFNNDRYSAESNAGPHVEAMFDTTLTRPVDSDNNRLWSSAASSSTAQAETCLFPTGDLFFDEDENPNNDKYPSDNLFDSETAKVKITGYSSYETHRDDIYDFWRDRSAARNFFVEHVVWKRMSGGNLTLPAQNARGLGGVPWAIHKVGSDYVKFGETIYGNVRFTFESTNAAMYPIIQAQELAHPALAEQFPYEVKYALNIPNEEMQFETVVVVDDTGQEHTLEGGSPLGVVIRDYELIHDRENEGLAPALAGSGVSPNMKIRLPNHDEIPGNILVRAGFDRLQAYQNETMGSGGLQHPSQPVQGVKDIFESTAERPKTAPRWEQEGYEHINQNPNNFPDSNNSLQSNNILETAYEPHDRALYFHVTKMGYTYTEREPMSIINNAMTLNRLTVDEVGTNTITAKETITASIWKQDATPDGRYFLAVNGTIASFTDVSGKQFTGVVFAPDFTAKEDDAIKPSFYVPAGTTRHFAARRLRDHAEVSGNSPDKPNTDWTTLAADTSPATLVRAANKLTPMPLPRMGHHYVTPTMAVMPGHLAHPLYQKLNEEARACFGATDYVTDQTIHNPLLWFSGVTAPNPPSDIHGDGFTLLTETKIRFDGYGIADKSASCNEVGGHRIQLESGTNYNTQWNFPDPAEVGAYQIVIQPNLFSKQFMGNNHNTAYDSDDAPEDPDGTKNTTKRTLTDQLVVTVVAMQGRDLILSEATMADIRGCEIYLNEVMLDIDPSTREQFTNIPILGLANPFGVNATSSGAFTRRSLPYHPNMFRRASPGNTVTVPWWSVALDSSTIFSTNNWKRVEQYQPDDYYHFCRSTLGAVGTQTTMLGYPSHYLDVYTEYLTSMTPIATIEGSSQSLSKLYVRNNTLFPLVGSDYYNNHLVIIDANGVEQTATYTDRGYISGTGGASPTIFNGVTAVTSGFWAAAVQGATLRMSSPYNNYQSKLIYSDSEKSVATRNLPQLLSGTRDTNSLHLPDAYLCMWHYNVGRPMTWFSDSRTNKGDAAADKKAYNHAPEHFETVHYHEFTYAMSDGPFKFRMKAWEGPGDGLTDTYPDSNYPHQAGTDGKSRKYQLGAFWSGGHRFGAQMSSLSLYGTAMVGWRDKWDDGNIKQVSDAKGVTVTESDVETITETINSVASTKKQAGWGYRISVRQPYNRPRWAIKANQALRDPYIYYHYHAEGPFVSNDSASMITSNQVGTGSSTTTVVTDPTYVGIIERQTNASALIGSDLKFQQVKYSDGRRMTKGFGCAVRNIRNPTTALRKFHADTPTGHKAGTDVDDQRVNLALAQAHYMIDWWGNTTGEDVRRFPVRGFGIRPSWDAEDAYRATDRTKTAETMYSDSGLKPAEASIHFFDPATAKRVGDRGDGRGVRYPTYFNEDILQDVSEDMRPFGLVLSHHTSEPPFTNGLIRPSNVNLESHEIPRGISARLELAGDDGLLKREANIGSNIEKSNFTFMQEPIAKSKPRIGLDTMTVGENDGEISASYAIASTEAHSLHTDRQVGQRFILAGGVSTSDKAIGNLNLHTLNLSSAKQVLKFGTTHGIPPIGGTYILEVSSEGEPINDYQWGASSGVTTNPYQTSNHDSTSYKTNAKDETIKFLVRPVRVLDNKHIELFRDDTSHVLSATAAGRYGVFMYDAPNARAADAASAYMRGSNPSPSNPPYAPVYLFDLASSTSAPSSVGPKIAGSEASDFKSTATQAVARMIVSSNTLQHFRGDASRKQSVTEDDEQFVRLNYSVQPRFTQQLYAGDDLNTSEHDDEGKRADAEGTL